MTCNCQLAAETGNRESYAASAYAETGRVDLSRRKALQALPPGGPGSEDGLQRGRETI
jgi:hypothetical protein